MSRETEQSEEISFYDLLANQWCTAANDLLQLFMVILSLSLSLISNDWIFPIVIHYLQKVWVEGDLLEVAEPLLLIHLLNKLNLLWADYMKLN